MNKAIKILCMLLCLLFVLCACDAKNNASTVNDTSSKSSNDSTSDVTLSNSTAKECFEKILNNEKSFYSPYEESDIILSDHHLFNKEVSYAYVDMDNDNIDELAIWLYGGNTLILRIDGESVIGFEFGVRAMSTIFTDGCFLWKQDAGNTYGCSRLEFTGKTYKTIELWRVEIDDSGSTSYYIDGKAATKEELDSLNDESSHQYIKWISFSTTP